MAPLSWTGVLAPLLPVLWTAAAASVLLLLVRSIGAALLPAGGIAARGGGAGAAHRATLQGLDTASRAALYTTLCVLAALLLAGIALSTGAGILGGLARRLLPVWVALAGFLGGIYVLRSRLGLLGHLVASPVGMLGLGLVSFWILAGIFAAAGLIVTHDPLAQAAAMKNAAPGAGYTQSIGTAPDGIYPHYLLGGDNLGRDVFSRMIAGAWVVVRIAPLATIFAFMVGMSLGLPAAYYRGALDAGLTFLANLILSFPVILLFYLLVTPEIAASGLPAAMAAVLFLLPLAFVLTLLGARYSARPGLRWPVLGLTGAGLGWLYLSLVSETGGALDLLPPGLDLFDIPGGLLVVFVAVVFVNAPIVFRIVRGLALDIRSRDYVAAAQTRGEGPWYIMLWEILPNTRGPLIVDFCLRVGYTTILLGTLGFFGLGLPPESPDWGTTINDGRRLLSIYPHPAIVPALALLSLVLGLNLLADGLREESLKD